MYASNNSKNGSLNGHSHAPAAESEVVRVARRTVSLETPIKPASQQLTNAEKIEQIADHFESIMDLLGLDLSDDSLQGTPKRVAKMFVSEVFKGLSPANRPKISLFENNYDYKQMLVERDITVKSFCEHHFLPILGRAHVAYIPGDHVIGLSKLNRIVDYFARRPQVQERLTKQIGAELRAILGTEDVAVVIDARHMCVEVRGVEHDHSTTVTSDFGGRFLNENVRQEFLQSIKK